MKKKYVAPEIMVINIGKLVLLHTSASLITDSSVTDVVGNSDAPELGGSDNSEDPEVAAKPWTPWDDKFAE